MTGVSVLDCVVPGGAYWAGALRHSDRITVRNTQGTQGVAAFIWCENDPSERLNVADSMKVQGTTQFGRGSALLTDMGRVLAFIEEDSCGRHDAVIGGSTRMSVRTATDGAGDIPNAQDHFRTAAGKFGLDRRDVGPSIVFFSGLRIDAGGNIEFDREAVVANQIVGLRITQNALCVISNTVHPLAEAMGETPRDIELEIVRGDGSVAEPTDLPDRVSQELARAFQLTEEHRRGTA